MMVVRIQSLDCKMDCMMEFHTLVSDIHNSVLAKMLHCDHDDDVLRMVRNLHEQHDYHHLKKGRI